MQFAKRFFYDSQVTDNDEIAELVLRRWESFWGITPEHTIPFHDPFVRESESAVTRGFISARGLIRGIDSHGVQSIRRRQHDWQGLFAGPVIERFQFTRREIEFFENGKLCGHVTCDGFKHAMPVMFPDWQAESDVVLDDMGEIAIPNLNPFGQKVVGEFRWIFRRVFFGFFAGLEPEGHLIRGLQLMIFRDQMQQTTRGGRTRTVVS